jgi:uncharacterized protein
MKKPNLGILIKPASHDCNMACSYCYYRPVQRLYPDEGRPRMTPEVFQAVCQQYRALEPAEIKVGWQGGEPTLMGLDFFRRAVEIEAEHARPGDCWGNSLQTNGALLNDDWAAFLAANRFLVGISLDGPAELNGMRRSLGGQPVHEDTMRAVELLRRHKVEFNVLVVVSRANCRQPRRIFDFLVANDLHYSQFIPCTEPAAMPGDAPGAVSEHSITGAEYGDFMIELFDAWIENDDPSYYVRHIDNWLHQFFGLPPECCEYREDCSNLITVEWNGDVYPCDFFVEPRYRMGNVLEQTLEQMLNGPAFRAFVSAAEHVPSTCADCGYLGVCHAGCFRHRQKLGIEAEGMPYLCEAKTRIFSHVFSTLWEVLEKPAHPQLHAFLRRIAGEVSGGRHGPSRPAKAPRRPDAAAEGRRPPQRNDVCPCGSGKKFKHCCGRAAVVRGQQS